ncbi:MAG: hypothetical protein ACYDHX_14520 [Methanothrix sp.]
MAELAAQAAATAESLGDRSPPHPVHACPARAATLPPARAGDIVRVSLSLPWPVSGFFDAEPSKVLYIRDLIVTFEFERTMRRSETLQKLAVHRDDMIIVLRQN